MLREAQEAFFCPRFVINHKDFVYLLPCSNSPLRAPSSLSFDSRALGIALSRELYSRRRKNEPVARHDPYIIMSLGASALRRILR